MTPERDVLDLLVAYHDHIEPPRTPVHEDLERGRRRQRRRRTLHATAVLVTVAAVGVGVWAAGARDADRSTLPAGAPSIRPSSTTTTQAPGAPGLAIDRPAAMTEMATPATGPELTSRWADPRDAEPGGVDILDVHFSQVGSGGLPQWRLTLRTQPPPPQGPDIELLEYGIVVDGDGDRVADCRIGLSGDARVPGEIRTWITNLRTGEFLDSDGPPYGKPVDFRHPHDIDVNPMSEDATLVSFFFPLRSILPCEGWRGTGGYYAWAAFAEERVVTSHDVAPDVGWLPFSWDVRD